MTTMPIQNRISGSGCAMGRRRSVNVKLPRDVQAVVNRHGQVYYYYAPGRGTKAAGKRIPLGTDARAADLALDCRATGGRRHVATRYRSGPQ
jgi:hypothetical protein